MDRHIFLDLRKIYFPISAIASIFHRITGLLLFICIPFLLWALQTSLKSAVSYHDLITYLNGSFSKFIIWILFTNFFYHLFAGIRHLIQDFGWGESLKAGRISAITVMILTALIAIYMGIWLW